MLSEKNQVYKRVKKYFQATVPIASSNPSHAIRKEKEKFRKEYKLY